MSDGPFLIHLATADVLGFELTGGEMKAIASLDTGHRYETW